MNKLLLVFLLYPFILYSDVKYSYNSDLLRDTINNIFHDIELKANTTKPLIRSTVLGKCVIYEANVTLYYNKCYLYLVIFGDDIDLINSESYNHLEMDYDFCLFPNKKSINDIIIYFINRYKFIINGIKQGYIQYNEDPYKKENIWDELMTEKVEFISSDNYKTSYMLGMNNNIIINTSRIYSLTFHINKLNEMLNRNHIEYLSTETEQEGQALDVSVDEEMPDAAPAEPGGTGHAVPSPIQPEQSPGTPPASPETSTPARPAGPELRGQALDVSIEAEKPEAAPAEGTTQADNTSDE